MVYLFTHKQNTTNGYITLISVLVVGAVGLAISISLILLGLGSSRTSFVVEQSNQAKGLVNACVEEALQQVRDVTAFTGQGSLSFGEETCTYSVTDQGVENRTIIAFTTVDETVTRKVRVLINQIIPTIQVVSWEEVADF